MDALTVLNTAVGLMSLALGGFAIWLSFQFYSKATDAEEEDGGSVGSHQGSIRSAETHRSMDGPVHAARDGAEARR